MLSAGISAVNPFVNRKWIRHIEHLILRDRLDSQHTGSASLERVSCHSTEFELSRRLYALKAPHGRVYTKRPSVIRVVTDYPVASSKVTIASARTVSSWREVGTSGPLPSLTLDQSSVTTASVSDPHLYSTLLTT